MEKYEIKVKIYPEDIDQLNHVNNTVYLRWVQEAAVAHWQVLASQEDQEKLFWVVARHEIDYKRPALLHDKIIARTWVGKRVRRNFERYTEIIRENDGKMLARGLTLWCPMDRKTGRPTDVSDAVRGLFSVPG
jgi:acyl-CoA thioester hydrolase